MNKHWKSITFVSLTILSVALFSMSMLGFTHHFFGSSPSKPYFPVKMGQNSWFEAKNKRVVFFLVDALRFNMVYKGDYGTERDPQQKKLSAQEE